MDGALPVTDGGSEDWVEAKAADDEKAARWKADF